MHYLLQIALVAALAMPVWGGDELLTFSLDETSEQIVARVGAPADVDDSSPNYFSFFFKVGVRDEHDYSHVFCFRKSDGKLLSMTRNFDPEETIDQLFPAGTSSVYRWPSAEKPEFSARIRRLSGERVLLAMGCPETRQSCGQLILIRASALRVFFPWAE